MNMLAPIHADTASEVSLSKRGRLSRRGGAMAAIALVLVAGAAWKWLDQPNAQAAATCKAGLCNSSIAFGMRPWVSNLGKRNLA